MENVRLLSTGTGFLIVLILHVYAFRHILSWATRRITTRYRSLVQVYEDQDGEATQQTIEHTAKWGLRLAILVIATAGMAIVGLRMGLAMPHIQYPANVAYWMEFGVWVRTSREISSVSTFLHDVELEELTGFEDMCSHPEHRSYCSLLVHGAFCG